MKKLLTLGLLLFLALKTFAQTEGISYQAVIIGPDALELPGVDSEGNYLPLADITVKFSIIAPGSGVIVFSETQDTTTDEYGRINLIIGQGNYDDFEKIYWDDTPKSLEVEIDFNDGNGFVLLSTEKLTYVPYVQHRTIKASDSLVVDGNTTLKGELTVVNQPTNLGGTFNVNDGNTSNLSGDLNVDGATNLFAAVTVGEFNGTPDADAPTLLNGSLEVKGKSTFGALESRTLKVNDSTELNGVTQINSDTQVKITSTLEGPDLEIDSYPLLVEGGNQGIAIRVNAQGALNRNNFVSFWDETPVNLTPYEPTLLNAAIRDFFDLLGVDDTKVFDGFSRNAEPGANTISGVALPNIQGPMLWGRIEGETDTNEFVNNADYNLDQLGSVYDFVDGTLDLAWEITDLSKATFKVTAASTSSTACLGIGGCFTVPIPSLIIAESSSLALQILKVFAATANQVFASYTLNTFYDNKSRYRGVSYASGAGDYAEYLIREDISEKMTYGDIVGVKGGKISKNTSGAERMMVISYKPAVLGALPQESQEQFFEKVAFMGQVPVKVIGVVNIGDYIVPCGGNNGVGMAIAPEDITAKDIKNIVGVAWEASENKYGYNLINTAVGINNNDNNPIVEKLEKQVLEQQNQLNHLNDLLVKTIERIEAIENGETTTNYDDHSAKHYEDSKENVDYYGRKYEIKDGFIYYELSDKDVDEALNLAEKTLSELGATKMEKYIVKKIKEDSEFKQKVITQLKDAFKTQVHFHKEVNEKF